MFNDGSICMQREVLQLAEITSILQKRKYYPHDNCVVFRAEYLMPYEDIMCNYGLPSLNMYLKHLDQFRIGYECGCEIADSMN